MDDALVVQVRLQGGGTVITVAGEVDIATAPRLGHHLAPLAGSGRPVIADLDQVSFIDAAGLRVLAAAARQAAAAGGSLHVVSGRYQVRRVFALTGWTGRYRWPAPSPGPWPACPPAREPAVPGTTRPAARGRRRPCRILAGAAGHSHDTRPERR
jgi:anti-sigma B factor antagonist